MLLYYNNNLFRPHDCAGWLSGDCGCTIAWNHQHRHGPSTTTPHCPFINVATVFNEPLTLNGGSYSALRISGAKDQLLGWPHTLNAEQRNRKRTMPSVACVSTSALAGAGGINKSGPGTLVLEGNNANTYRAPRRWPVRPLVAGPNRQAPSAVTRQLGALGGGLVLSVWGGSQQIADTADVLVNSGGLFRFRRLLRIH